MRMNRLQSVNGSSAAALSDLEEVLDVAELHVVAGEGADLKRATALAAQMLRALGIPECEDGKTPHRLVLGLAEMTAGLHVDPTRHLDTDFDAAAADLDIICVPDVDFWSLCEHHLFPFQGTAHIAYLPAAGGRVAGLSKIPRMFLDYAHRPQLQEALGQQALDGLVSKLAPAGAGIVIDSTHQCMAARGARAHRASMLTSHTSGLFAPGGSHAELISTWAMALVARGRGPGGGRATAPGLTPVGTGAMRSDGGPRDSQ